MEESFEKKKGVIQVISGYSGGNTKNPTYEEVCSGLTGHNEVVLVVFDPTETTFDNMLKLFWENHDPTQGMRQGNDVGTQYRSAIFPADDQKDAAHAAIARWNEEHPGQTAVTTVESGEWYPAEDYHQEYWEGEGQRNPYCQATIPPKLMKLRKSFQKYVKEGS